MSPLIPADAVTIARMSGHDGAVLGYLRRIYSFGGEPAPHCFDEITGRIEDQYQLEIGPELRQVQVFVGAFDRDAVERCVGDFDLSVAVIMGSGREVHFSAERDGDFTKLTQVTHRGTRIAWIAWTPHRVVVAGERDLAREVIGGAHVMPADAPLARLWARTAGGDMRVASLRDVTRATGVASDGLFLSARMDDASLSKQVFAHVVLADEATASRALAALQAAPAEPGAAPALARVVELLQPRREGRELVVDIGSFLAAPDGLATLQALVGTP
jgi:hypothetical protein